MIIIIQLFVFEVNIIIIIIKASSGALEIIEVSSTDNMMRFLDKSQENGWQVFI
jgi:tRNA G18 (ribose-2'-O)-methylase SpoU